MFIGSGFYPRHGPFLWVGYYPTSAVTADLHVYWQRIVSALHQAAPLHPIIMYLKLNRHTSSGKAVLGTLYFVHFEAIGAYGHNERLTRICDTLENADYLVPEMIYRVQVTQSPKFGRLLPILEQVPGRSGIRLHRGTRPEHSKGCILLPPKMEAIVTNQLLTAQKAHEEIRLDITHLRPGDRLPGMPGDTSAPSASDAQREP